MKSNHILKFTFILQTALSMNWLCAGYKHKTAYVFVMYK